MHTAFIYIYIYASFKSYGKGSSQVTVSTRVVVQQKDVEHKQSLDTVQQLKVSTTR